MAGIFVAAPILAGVYLEHAFNELGSPRWA